MCSSDLARKRGKIINIASIAGLKGSLGPMQTIAYNTSKAAAINFTRALAAEWGKYGINVNAICPGFFPTKMAAGLLDKLGQSVIDHTPLQRLGDESDLKGAVVFLAIGLSSPRVRDMRAPGRPTLARYRDPWPGTASSKTSSMRAS